MNYEILFFACAGVCFVGILSNIVALQPSDYGNFTKNGPLRLSLYISTVKTRLIRQRAKKSFVIQVTALRADIDKLALDLKRYGLISTSRTGAVAMTKGAQIFT